MPTISGETGLLEKPDERAVDFVSVTQCPDLTAQHAFGEVGGSKTAAGVTCRTN